MPPRGALLVLAIAALAGCGDGGGGDRAVTATRTATPAARAPEPAARPRPPARVRRAHCGAGATNCAAVTGHVLYVEAVDPDGDGDAHYVLAGGSVTAPGLTVIDVEASLRPRRLPKPGELVSAAGPVYRGSHGQHQIQAVELHHQRRGRVAPPG